MDGRPTSTPRKLPSTDTDERLKMAIAVVLALVLAVGAALVFRSGADPPTGVAADQSTSSTTTTSTTEATTSTTFQPGTTATSIAPETTTTTTTTTTTPPPPETTTTTASADRRCMELNALTANGLSGELCQEGASVAGERTSLHLTARDGNAHVRDDCGSPTFAWGDEDTAVCAIGCEPSNEPTGPSEIDVTRYHVYATPGTYDVEVTVESNCGGGVGGERQTFELQLTIG